MLDESKNLKDTPKDTISMPVAYEANDFRSGSYKKTNKLVSALYMVTDIMEKDEPLRNKLRTLGADIVSDTYLLSIPNPSKVRQLNLGTRGNIEIKIAELLSFLEISSSINLISEMNYRILKKEFIELEQSVQEYIRKSSVNQPATLSEFFIEDSKGHAESFTFFKGHPVEDKGHETTRIGVQKGSTLLKALSKMNVSNKSNTSTNANNFDALKKERRDEILSIVKANSSVGGVNVGVTITDIKTKAKGPIASCGEKTLQRELISMVKDKLLTKTGEKRWSRYFLTQ